MEGEKHDVIVDIKPILHIDDDDDADKNCVQSDALSSLPDEVLLYALELLPMPDVLSSRNISTRFDSLAREPELVNAVTKRDFGCSETFQDWSSYRHLKTGMETRAKSRLIRRQQLEAVHKREEQQKLCFTIFTVFHEQVLPVFLAFCFMLGLLFIPLRLDGILPYSWSIIMMPWLLIVALLWIGTVTIACVNVFHLHWLFENIQHTDWNGPLTALSREMVRSGKAANLTATLMLASLSFCCISVTLYLDSTITWPLSVVLTPAWLFFAFFFLAPLTGWAPGPDREIFFSAVWFLGLGWLLAFLLLLCIHIDAAPNTIKIEYAFLPLWILDGLVLSCSIIGAISASIFAIVHRDRRVNFKDALSVLLFAIFIILLLGPITVSEVLLVLNLNNVINWPMLIVFAPIIIWSAIIFILTILFALTPDL